jgi:hypothetical protein
MFQIIRPMGLNFLKPLKDDEIFKNLKRKGIEKKTQRIKK